MTEQAPAPAKKLPIKTIAVVLVMLVLEAGLIIGAISIFGRPSPVQGTMLVNDPNAKGETLTEVPVLHDKFANNSTGRLWYWDTEILLQVKEKNRERVTSQLEARAAEIRTGIGAVLAGAQHTFFNEPGRTTLTRQVQEYMQRIIGTDPEGNQLVTGVLIPKCIGFPADY